MVAPVIATETVSVRAPDGVRQQVMIGMPVPPHLLDAYKAATGNRAPAIAKPETAAAKAKREKAERDAANPKV